MVTQTAENTTTTPAGGEREVRRRTAFGAALAYAEHGWPVFPGSAWNGRRYQIPGTARITSGVQPTVPRNYATTRPKTITEWWGTRGPLVPAVLLRSGLELSFLSMARPLASKVIVDAEFQSQAGPVVFRPDQGRAYFLTTPGEIPADGFGGKPDDVELMETGSWIVVPPGHLSPGVNVAWWVTPERVDWKPAQFEVVRNVVARVLNQQGPPITE